MSGRAQPAGRPRGLVAAAVATGLLVSVPQANPLDVVKIRVSPYVGYAPFHIADAEGFFAREGLQAEFIDLASGSAFVPALVRGDIDVLPAVVNPAVFNAIVRGSQMRIVASQSRIGSSGCAITGLIASKALAESGALTHGAQLRGRRVSTGTALVTAYFLDQALKPLGLTSKDLQVSDAPDAAAAEALRTGRLDLAAVGEPTLSRVLADGSAVLWKSDATVLPGFQYSVVAYGPSLVQARQDVGRRFMTAYLRGVRQFRLGKTPRNLDILSGPIGFDRTALTRACWPSIPQDAAVNGSSLLEFQAWALANGYVDRALTVAEMVDTRFVEYANKVLATSSR
jgi:NitT/TauT family transport system substrate-binding protein